MNNLQIFNNERFGRVRIIMSDENKPMFLANDVARSLGYIEYQKAIRTHCKGVSEMDTPTDGGIQRVKYIPESDVYRLVMRSKLPQAEQFQDWVCDEDQKIDVGQAAKILNLPFGRNTLFQRLRERGIFFCNRNEPKQEYINRGYFELKEKLIDRNNHESFTVIKVLVTQKGLDFLARQFEVVQTPKKMAPIK